MRRAWTCALAAMALSWHRPVLAQTQTQQPNARAQGGGAPAHRGTTGASQGVQGTTDTAATDARERAQNAFAGIIAAQKAIDRNDTAAANEQLATARRALDHLYGSNRGANVVKEIDRVQANLGSGGKGVDFAPLTSAVVSRSATYLDPDVVAGVKEAEKASKEGKTEAASDALRLARQAVVADVALLPVESAYARVVAAQALLAQGNRNDARRMLAGVPVELAQLEIRTPLVPVRFSLRAAAEAADAKDWRRAEQLIESATADLQRMKRDAPADLASELKPVVDEALQLQSKARGAKEVDARQLRALANRTLSIGAQARASGANGEHYVIGRVANATKDHITIDAKRQGMVSLGVGGATSITFDGRKTSTDHLQPGAPVFAAYEQNGRERIATHVRVDPPRASDRATSDPSAEGAQEPHGQGSRETTAPRSR